jgi:opacity protein-like surface antigen
MRIHSIVIGAVAAVALTGAALANEFTAPITKLADTKVRQWIKDPAIIDAVKAQNQKHAGLTQADIDALDKKWRAETGSSSQPMIQAVLSNSLSKFLKTKKESSKGLYTEIFVMDNKGLNVGQSDVSSDYWQGDEAKWKKTYPVGANAIHISDVEKDESTQTFQSQLSLPVVDPANNQVIGAITLGINVEQLAH